MKAKIIFKFSILNIMFKYKKCNSFIYRRLIIRIKNLTYILLKLLRLELLRTRHNLFLLNML